MKYVSICPGQAVILTMKGVFFYEIKQNPVSADKKDRSAGSGKLKKARFCANVIMYSYVKRYLLYCGGKSV